jgi:iron complex outermembrane receptor protein
MTTKTLARACAWTIAFTAMGLAAAVAQAQTAAPSMTDPDDQVIVVQGQTRWRDAAPYSGAPIGAEMIARLDLDTLDAVAVAVPGLSMINDQDPGTNIVAMRGVTTDRLQQAAVAFVLDDVPLADTEFFTGPLFDVARIDVLRGPQGALFGKSAAGGAIEVATRGANAPDGFVALSVGDGGLRAFDAARGGEIGGDWAVRAATRWSAADGWITNRTLNRVVDAEESRALRLRAAGPFAGGDLDLSAFHVHEDGGAAWASSNNVIGRFGGKLSGAALSDPIGDFEGRSARRWCQAAARYKLEWADQFEITALIARDAYAKRWVEELDYRPGPLTFFGAPVFPAGLQPIRQPTDINATTAQTRFSWTLRGADGHADTFRMGLFAQDIDRRRIDDFGPLLFGANAAAYDTDTLQRAAFFAYGLTRPNAALDVNLRYDTDRRRQRITDAGTGAARALAHADFARWQPRIAASARLYAGDAGATWMFGAYGEGFRSGGFNPTPSPASIWRARFEPEVTRSGELGLRHIGQSLWMEAVIFAAQISDYQNYTFLDGNSVTLSVDQVDVEGGEFSVRLDNQPLLDGQADFGLGLAYAEATIARYRAPDPLIAGAERDYSGKRVPNAPVWSGAARVDWTRPFGDAALELGATVNATGETFFEIDNRLRAPGKTWLDLRGAVRLGDVRIGLLVRNATDERWAISGFGQAMLPLLAGLGPDGPFDTFTLNRGRQMSVEFRRSF